MKHILANTQLLESQRLFRKALNNAEYAYEKGNLESAVAWAKIGAHMAYIRRPGFYTDASLENLLLSIAEKADQDQAGSVNLPFKPKDYGKMRFLHVITESYASGGISSFIEAWIKNTAGNSVHSLITTTNQGEIRDSLASSIVKSGGWYGTVSELSPNLLERAVFLRKIAKSWADVIVLFVHPFDPLPIVAFGVEGGPPIIFINHSDHTFWLGSTVADVIVDFHSSGETLSVRRRGTFPSRVVPIPLINPKHPARGVELRKKLKLIDNDVMLLTVGSDEKFLPFGDYDFLAVIVKILKKYPNAKLFASRT